MTMYLPNPDVCPTGDEPGEFIDPAIVVPTDAEPRRRDVGDEREATERGG